MKKLFITIIAMLLPMLASAQTFIRSLNNYSFGEIPKDLCLLNHKYFFPYDLYQDIKIYDEKFELVKEINTNNNPIFPKYNSYYKKEIKDKNGEWVIETESNTEQSAYLCYQFTNYNGQNFGGCPFSQTLFSDDEIFEFYIPVDIETVENVYEDNNTRETRTSIKAKGVNVITETGEVLATFRQNDFYFTFSTFQFNRVDNIIYAIFSTSDENNHYALYKVDRPWSSASNPSFSGKQGDVNKDGSVNVADHVELTKIIMNEE